ncbi:CoxG family protein [Natranaeroarchaeum sulfidigenes]|uniref:Carbon monoxide dehydrogenase subunit G, CoxG n=1 Tax=Natranaeroarchaeum sulfidigenes TaxID=2784880 RepID=A0A897MU55_9EURY|nr:SRPBCC domain-containing protein [Natranaeroarchaeum sulfidigenes]QSG04007.1 Carbon monoxide dehydrogenase subunit G, CoxG [Natranaeroarchaeum sulfidigenes]
MNSQESTDTAEGEGSGDEAERDDTQLEFEDSVTIDAGKEELWGFISEAQNLAQCIPGAESVTRETERRYTCEVTRGISKMTISIDGELEMVEMNEPDWIVADGEAFDSTTGSRFDVLAAMEMSEVEGDRTELAYTAELSYSGGVASLPKLVVRKAVTSDLNSYFENIRTEIEPERE